MAGRSLCARALAMIFLASACHMLTMDEDAATNVIEATNVAGDGGEVAILLHGPHGRNVKREELLHAKGADDSSVNLYFHRKSNKVTLETHNNGHLKSVSWGLGSHAKSTLLLVVSANRVRLFVGCHALHSHPVPSRHNLLPVLGNEKLKLYHEENAPIEVFSNERDALDSLNCNPEIKPPTQVADESDVEEVKDFMQNDARRKREQMQGDDYRVNYIDANGILPTPSTQRGDIPANAIETCDDEVIRHLQQLSVRIEQLHRVAADQKATIDSLRAQLRQCCARAPPPPERCTQGSCYPGY